MTKKSYLESFKKNHHAASDACRTTMYKAAVAHIYGDALQLQYDCAYSFISDESGYGQIAAISLSDTCSAILAQDGAFGFDAKADLLNQKLQLVYDFLNAA